MSSVFVSYAHVDNQAFAGEEQGWISHFIHNLRVEVDRHLGRLGAFDPWMDFRLKANDEVTPEIEKQLEEAQILLLFFSQGWHSSDWCQKELELFARAPEKRHSGRVFLVEMDGLKLQDRPELLHDALGAKFWDASGTGRVRNLGYPVPKLGWCDPKPYFDKLYDLAGDLAQKLVQPLAPPPPVEVKATVYLAPVHGALHASRGKLATELRQFGIESLPADNELDILDFKDQMLKDLAKCSHFVQLLDADPDWRLPDAQWKLAQASAKPILQWRDSSLDLDKAPVDKKHREFLEGPQVIARTLSEFAGHVREAVFPKPKESPPEIKGDSLVFVHAGAQDLDLAKKIAERLEGRGHGILLPRYQGEPGKIRLTIKRNLKLCTALLIVQQETPDDVVEDYLGEALLHSKSLDKPLPMAVCRKPDAEKFTVRPSNLRICPCQADFDLRCVEQFLQQVGS